MANESRTVEPWRARGQRDDLPLLIRSDHGYERPVESISVISTLALKRRIAAMVRLLPLLPLLLGHVAALENGLGRRPVRACHGRSIATCSASALVCRSH